VCFTTELTIALQTNSPKLTKTIAILRTMVVLPMDGRTEELLAADHRRLVASLLRGEQQPSARKR
jgi:hypothetical protein